MFVEDVCLNVATDLGMYLDIWAVPEFQMDSNMVNFGGLTVVSRSAPVPVVPLCISPAWSLLQLDDWIDAISGGYALQVFCIYS